MRAEVSFTETITMTIVFPSERFEESHGGPFASVEEFQEYLNDNADDLWDEPEVGESNRHDWNLDDASVAVEQVVPDKGDPAPVRREDAVDVYRLRRALSGDRIELLDFGGGRWGLCSGPFSTIAVRMSPEAVLELAAGAGTPEYAYLAAQLQSQHDARQQAAAARTP